MPHEVFCLEGLKAWNGDETLSTKDRVSDEIKKTYDDITDRGGQVVGAHVLSFMHRRGTVEKLFIVAEFATDQKDPAAS